MESSDFVKAVESIVRDVFDIENGQIGSNVRFYEDLHADSLDMVELVGRLEGLSGRKLSSEGIARLKTIESAARELSDLEQVQLSEVFVRTGAEDAVALMELDGPSVTYRDLSVLVDKTASLLLRRLGGVKGRVLLVSDDSVDLVVTVLGCWKIGIVPIVVSPMLTVSGIAQIAADADAVGGVLLADLDLTQRVTAEVPSIAWVLTDEVRSACTVQGGDVPVPYLWSLGGEAVVQYTSGSTGVPKGVRHSVNAILALREGAAVELGLNATDVVLTTPKMSFGYGFGCALLLPLLVGATSVLLPGIVEPNRVARAIVVSRPTVIFAVPRLYVALLAIGLAREVKERIRLCVSAGEQAPALLLSQLAEVFETHVLDGLGATEVLHVVVTSGVRDAENGHLGRPVLGSVISVRSASGEPLAEGIGRLHVAGPTVALGYIGNPNGSDETFTDGGAYTGDLCNVLPTGEVMFLGRADEILNLGGHRVAPAEIEREVRRVEGVVDCAVVAYLDENELQRAALYIVPSRLDLKGLIIRSVRKWLREALADYKRPSRYEVVEHLPTTATGKLARYRLKETRV